MVRVTPLTRTVAREPGVPWTRKKSSAPGAKRSTGSISKAVISGADAIGLASTGVTGTKARLERQTISAHKRRGSQSRMADLAEGGLRPNQQQTARLRRRLRHISAPLERRPHAADRRLTITVRQRVSPRVRGR